MIAVSKPKTRRPDDGTQCVTFDIQRGNQRTPVTLTTKFATQELATRYFHANRPLIEKLAREQLTLTEPGDGEINLVMV